MEGVLLPSNVSWAIFRFFLGRSDDMTSGTVSREVLVPTLCKRSSFFLLVPAVTALAFVDDGTIGRVTVVEEDPPETLEMVDVADVRLCMAAVKFEYRDSSVNNATCILSKTYIFDAIWPAASSLPSCASK